jgi:hypothetical protein
MPPPTKFALAGPLQLRSGLGPRPAAAPAPPPTKFGAGPSAQGKMAPGPSGRQVAAPPTRFGPTSPVQAKPARGRAPGHPPPPTRFDAAALSQAVQPAKRIASVARAGAGSSRTWSATAAVPFGTTSSTAVIWTPARRLHIDRSGKSRNPVNLEDEESKSGHAIRDHVGKNKEALNALLDKKKKSPGASTYHSREAAESVIAEMLEDDAIRAKLAEWIARPWPKRYVVKYRSLAQTGLRLDRQTEELEETDSSTTVLEKIEGAKEGDADNVRIVTSYPHGPSKQ